MITPDDDWNEASPQHIPPPTYWPVILALGITFFFWGAVTSFIISIVGLIIFSVALAGWIADLRREITVKNQNETNHGS